MKRLSFMAFKAKRPALPMDQLLGQVLGNCHDQGGAKTPKVSKKSEQEGT